MPFEKVRVYSDVDTQFSPWEWTEVAPCRPTAGRPRHPGRCARSSPRRGETAAKVWKLRLRMIVTKRASAFTRNTGATLSTRRARTPDSWPRSASLSANAWATGWYRVPEITEARPGDRDGERRRKLDLRRSRVARSASTGRTGEVKILPFASLRRRQGGQPRRGARTDHGPPVVSGDGRGVDGKDLFTKRGRGEKRHLPGYKIPASTTRRRSRPWCCWRRPTKRGRGARSPWRNTIARWRRPFLNALRDATGVEFTALPVTPGRNTGALENPKGGRVECASYFTVNGTPRTVHLERVRVMLASCCATRSG